MSVSATYQSHDRGLICSRYENGRRYHAFRAGNYPIPNDEKEQDRLDFVGFLQAKQVHGLINLTTLDASYLLYGTWWEASSCTHW